MNTQDIDNVLDKVAEICSEVEEALVDHNFETSYQVPNLVKVLAEKLDWTDKQAKTNDQVVRYFLKDHSKYMISSGAKGGIKLRASKVKNKEDSALKKKHKEEFLKAVEDKLSKNEG